MFKQPYGKPNVRSFDRLEIYKTKVDITTTYIETMRISYKNKLYVVTFKEPMELAFRATTWEAEDDYDKVAHQTLACIPAMGSTATGSGQGQGSALEDLKEYILVKYLVGQDIKDEYPEFVKTIHKTCTNFIDNVEVFE